MLQVVPGISRQKAENLMKHYPYPQLLLAAMSDSRYPENDRKKLLADKLDAKKNHVKLAALLFKIFTSLDPDEPIVWFCSTTKLINVTAQFQKSKRAI